MTPPLTPASGWSLMLPELWVGLLGLLALALDLKWKGTHPSRIGSIVGLGLLPVFPLLAWQNGLGDQEILGGMYRLDSLGLLFKGIFTAAAIGTVCMARELEDRLPRARSEFHLLILTALLGMLFAASSANFLMLFVSLELIAVTFYVLTSFRQTDPLSLEAGMKYLILGSLASGLILYGIAFLYGSAGSMRFIDIQAKVAAEAPLSIGLRFGLLLVLGGMLFKAAGVPFQLWVPDVYQGAPTPAAAFLSVGSKAAGFLVALRLLHEIFGTQPAHWSALVAGLAGLTILYGNLAAIPQKNIKRLLGYSSIGHAGYLLMGVAVPSVIGPTAVLFYLVGYLFTNLAAFLVVCAFSRQTGSDEIRDYAGLARRSPFLAAALFLSLLSLAGVPPLAGFFGKFLLLMGAVSEGYLWLAFIGAAAVVISLYYYLRIVLTMYADPPADPSPIEVRLPVRLALLACMAGMLAVGIWQGPVFRLCLAAVGNRF